MVEQMDQKGFTVIKILSERVGLFFKESLFGTDDHAFSRFAGSFGSNKRRGRRFRIVATIFLFLQVASGFTSPIKPWVVRSLQENFVRDEQINIV